MATEAARQPLLRWSTDSVPPAQRFDYYADALSSALTPMHLVAPVTDAFDARMSVIAMGGVALVRQQGSAHRCYREQRDVARSGERSFHLMVNLTSPWLIEHRGRTRLGRGDVMLADSALGHDITMEDQYDIVHLRLTDSWLRQWLPMPGKLVGHRIPGASGWGRALTTYMAQLSPQLILDGPLPASVLTDHVGGLLAIIAQGLEAETRPPARADRAVHQRVRDGIVQRCVEPQLTADALAAGLNMSTRTLHRSLARSGETFGALLQAARVEVACRMLESPLMRRLTVAEIGRRAGFVDPSHFSRVFRLRFGQTPSQARRTGGMKPLNRGEEYEPT